MESFKLTDLIDIDRLQKIQDSLSKITGMAIQISDQNGFPRIIVSLFFFMLSIAIC